MEERKDENYIPLGINAGDIITFVYLKKLFFLKFEQFSFALQKCVQKMHMQWQTVWTLIRLLLQEVWSRSTLFAHLSVSIRSSAKETEIRVTIDDTGLLFIIGQKTVVSYCLEVRLEGTGLTLKACGEKLAVTLIYEPAHDKTNKMTCAPVKTQISLGIRPVWSESLLSTWRNIGSLTTYWVQSEHWSDWADAQVDLSLCWVHMSFYWFCHAAAHIYLKINSCTVVRIKSSLHTLSRAQNKELCLQSVLILHKPIVCFFGVLQPSQHYWGHVEPVS